MSNSGGSSTASGLDEALRGALEPGAPRESVVTLATERGSRRWEVQLVPGVRDAAGATVVVAVARDVTQAGPPEAGRFLESGLAELGSALFHDLRGPLATIRSFLGFLAVDLKERDESRVAADIDSIKKAVDRMEDVLTDVAKRARRGEEGTGR